MYSIRKLDCLLKLVAELAPQNQDSHLSEKSYVASHPKQWIRQVQGTESLYYRVIGSAEAFMAKAEELGQVWMKGVTGEMARKILRERPT